MLKRRTLLAATAGLVTTAGMPAPRAKAATTVRFITGGVAEAGHGGFYQALAQGLFAQRGLDVEIIQGGPDVNVPRAIMDGAADLGLGADSFTAMNLVRARIPIRAVMAIFQKDLHILMSHPRRDINSIADMKGMPISVSAAAMNTFWPWLRMKFDFADSQIRQYTSDLAPFIANPNAIRESSLTHEPFMVEQKTGWEPKVFLLADYGYPVYANMILAPQKRIDQDPRTIQGFVDASREGWLHYLDDPGQGNALIRRANPDMTDAVLAQARDRMKRHDVLLSLDGRVYGLGSMTDKRWNAFYDMVSHAGLYPPHLDYARAYDLRFIRAALQKFQ